jgi:phosphohistidine phosphatase
MDLILWRHAEAQEWTQGCDDMARRLTVRGEKQAKRMAGWLDRQLPHNTRILVSPAIRSEQTVGALGRKLKLRS